MGFSLSKRYLQPDGKYVVAVSGGVDSMVLLHLLRKSLPQAQLSVAHFNHKTRNGASDSDEAFVKAWCDKEQLPFFLGVRLGEKISEEALRVERQTFLRKVASDTNSRYVLLAHHQDDQIETLFMRLLRGTSLKGLTGIKEKNGIFLRPLLDVRKKQILKYAAKHGIDFRVDESNSTSTYFRNRVRHELLPVFFSLAKQHGGQKKVTKRLSKLMLELNSIESWVSDEVRQILQAILVETPFFLRFSLEDYQKISKPLRDTVLRQIVSRAGMVSPDRQDIIRFRKFLKKPKREVHLSFGVAVQESLGQVYVTGKKHQAVNSDSGKLQTRGALWHYEHRDLLLSMSLKKTQDAEIRFFRPGDRVNGKKLKEVFLKARIPRPERCLVPLLAKKNSSIILWCFPEKHELVQRIKCDFPFSQK